MRPLCIKSIVTDNGVTADPIYHSQLRWFYPAKPLLFCNSHYATEFLELFPEPGDTVDRESLISSQLPSWKFICVYCARIIVVKESSVNVLSETRVPPPSRIHAKIT